MLLMKDLNRSMLQRTGVLILPVFDTYPAVDFGFAGMSVTVQFSTPVHFNTRFRSCFNKDGHTICFSIENTEIHY
jgi:hypothetical protein